MGVDHLVNLNEYKDQKRHDPKLLKIIFPLFIVNDQCSDRHYRYEKITKYRYKYDCHC